jgi:hypothetical protein
MTRFLVKRCPLDQDANGLCRVALEREDMPPDDLNARETKESSRRVSESDIKLLYQTLKRGLGRRGVENTVSLKCPIQLNK